MFASEHLWLNNGDIVHSRARSSRLIFLESENLDPLFRGIERIIGMPIEHMVITAARRAYRVYLSAFIPEELRQKIQAREVDYGPYDEMLYEVGRVNGTGKYALVSHRFQGDENDYDAVTITEPHSVPLSVAAHMGAIEMFTGVEFGYRYEEVSPDVFSITLFPSPHPEELKERLRFAPYEHQDSDLELERCPSCGGPQALSECRWYPDRGVIVNRATGRRMAILGEALLTPIFHELEEELGEDIPRAVVEAQRRFTKGGFYTREDITDKEGFRKQLAFRGLGNLKELEMRRKGMSMRLENATLPLMVVGLAQGFFEMGFSYEESDVEWEVSPDRVLEAEVKPRS